MTVALVLSLSMGALGAPQDNQQMTNLTKTVPYTQKEIKQGQEYLEKSANACGGLDKLRKIKNYEMTCKIKSEKQGTMDYREIKVFPDKFAQFIKSPMVSQDTYFNGRVGWIKTGETIKQMPPMQVSAMADQMKRDQFYLLSHANDNSIMVAYKGEGDFDGKKAMRVEVKLNESEIYSVFLDPDNYRIIGMKQDMVAAMGPTTMKISLLDYRDFNGIMMPTKIEQNFGSRVITVSDIAYKMDIDIDKTMFLKPDSLK